MVVDATAFFEPRVIHKFFYNGYISYLFGQYYPSILEEYRERGYLSADSVSWEKKDLAINFLLFFMLEYEYGFGMDEFEGDIKTEILELLKNEPYYPDFLHEYKKRKIRAFLKRKKKDVKRFLNMEKKRDNLG